MGSVLHEEGQWRFPHHFNPENFLDDHGQFVKPEAFVPFSVGEWTNQGSNVVEWTNKGSLWVSGPIRVRRLSRLGVRVS